MSLRFIKITNRFKSLLVRIIPIELLSFLKRKYLNKDLHTMLSYPRQQWDSKCYPEGINLIANIKADTGLGESSRIVASHLQNADVPFTIYDFYVPGHYGRSNEQFQSEITNTLPYGINLIHINPHEIVISLKEIGFNILDNHYNIGFWSWELEEFPEEWKGCIEVLDEVWTPSEFTSESIRKITDKPVRTLPHCVTTEIDKRYDRSYFGLPENVFLFLILYDNGSVAERKNPKAAILAYRKAFEDCEDGVGLVIKVSNISEHGRRELKLLVEGLQHIYFIFDNLEKTELNSLINSIDTYVSLHRAEGFGLVMAEAMKLGKVVIATGWSANTEFMNESVACIVDYELVPVNTKQGGFSKKSKWAEADVEQASNFMKHLKVDRAYYTKLCNAAQKYISQKLDATKIAQITKNYYQIIFEKEEQK